MTKKKPPSDPECICIRKLAHLLGITYGHVYSFVTSGLLPKPHELPQLGFNGWKKSHLLDAFDAKPANLERLIERAAKRAKRPTTKDEFLALLREGMALTTTDELKSAEEKVASLQAKLKEAEKRKLAKLQSEIATLQARLDDLDDVA